MESEWVTLKIFTYPHEAHPLKNKLESEGIETFLGEENFLTMYSWASIAAGGARLQVRRDQFERAKEILRTDFSDLVPDPGTERTCPECGSADVYYVKLTRKAFWFSVFLLGFPIPFLTRKWKCQNCSYQWDAR